MDAVHRGRIRHVYQGAATSGRGWQVAGLDEFQVDDVPHQKMKRGEGVTARES